LDNLSKRITLTFVFNYLALFKIFAWFV